MNAKATLPRHRREGGNPAASYGRLLEALRSAEPKALRLAPAEVSLSDRDRQEPHWQDAVVFASEQPGRSRYFSVVEAETPRLREHQLSAAGAQIQVDHRRGIEMTKVSVRLGVKGNMDGNRETRGQQ